jgi:hypothetical protein
MLCAINAHSAPAKGEQKKAEEVLNNVTNEKVFNFAYGIPASPAFMLIGNGMDATPPPQTLKKFALSIPGLLTDGGTNQTAALDISPAWLLDQSERSTYLSYVDGGYLFRLATRTRVGVAIARGTDGDGDAKKAVRSRLAVGIALPLFGGDPILAERPDNVRRPRDYKAANDLRHMLRGQAVTDSEVTESDKRAVDQRFLDACLYDMAPDAIAAMNAAELTRQSLLDRQRLLQEKQTKHTITEAEIEELGRISTQLQEALDQASATITAKAAELKIPARVGECVDTANTLALYSPSLDIGIGALWQGDPGELSGLDSAGLSTWFAFRYPLALSWASSEPESVALADLKVESYWMFAASGHASLGEEAKTGDATTPQFDADSYDVWAGIEYYTGSYRFVGRVGYGEVNARRDADMAFDRDGFRWQVGADVRLWQDDSSNIWLNAVYGSAKGSVDDLDGDILKVSISYSPPAPATLVARK